jgi:hypothetical protein
VERSLAWLLANRAPDGPQERRADILQAFLRLACVDLRPQAPTAVNRPSCAMLAPHGRRLHRTNQL